MIAPDLAEIAAQAAVACGWPTLHVHAPTEARVLAARAAVEALLGPLPQADTIEPWDATDPDEAWELRIDLPGLSADDWRRIRGAVEGLGEVAVLVPGVPPGMREAEDRGLRAHEPLEAAGLVARLPYDVEQGGVVAPELVAMPGADDEIAALERDLAVALRAISPELAFRSERGEGTVQPVVHRASGRFGARLSFDEPADPVALREAVVEGLAAVVRGRREHDAIRLAPDVVWDARFGLSFVLWFVAPAVAALPGDAPVADGATLAPGALEGLVEELEVHVVPAGPDRHDAVAEAVRSEGWLGGRPRWVRRPDGLAFVPVWRVPGAEGLRDAVDALLARDDVAAVRVVPGEPRGLAERWPVADPAWHPGAERVFVRVRDGVTDRDRLPVVQTREPTARDLALAEAVARTAVRRPVAADLFRGAPRPVVDAAGREGLELPLHPGGTMREAVLREGLDLLCALRGPVGLGTWGWRHDGPVAQLWWPAELEPDDAPEWG